MSPCVVYTGGAQHQNDAVAIQQQADALTALNHINALPAGLSIGPELGNTVTPILSGLYDVGAADITGTLGLDAANNPNSVWIFRASSGITAATGSNFLFSNVPAGTSIAQLACNVFWTAVSSAALNGTAFVGTVLASTSVSLGTGVTVTGRLSAGTGSVTLAGTDTINRGNCAVLPAGTGGTPASTGGGTGATPGGPAGATPSGPAGTSGGVAATAFSAAPATASG